MPRPPTKTVGMPVALRFTTAGELKLIEATDADHSGVSVLAVVVLIPVSGETPVWARLPRNIDQLAKPEARCRVPVWPAAPRCETGTARAAAPVAPVIAHSPASAAPAAIIRAGLDRMVERISKAPHLSRQIRSPRSCMRRYAAHTFGLPMRG